MTQPTSETRVRLSPRVNRRVARLAKSKAALQEVTLEWVVEHLLAGWVAGTFELRDDPSPKENPSRRQPLLRQRAQ